MFHVVPCFASFIAVFDRVHATTKSVSLLSLSRKGASPSAAAYRVTTVVEHLGWVDSVPPAGGLLLQLSAAQQEGGTS